MESQSNTVADYFKAIKVVHLALTAGVVFFALVSLLLQLKGFGTLGEELSGLLIYIIPVVAVLGIFGSNLIFKHKLSDCREKERLKDKLTEYRSALLIKFAVLEGASFISVISYLLTGELILLAMVGLLIVVFIIYIPTKQKLINDLELNIEDKKVIENPDYEY